MEFWNGGGVFGFEWGDVVALFLAEMGGENGIWCCADGNFGRSGKGKI